MTEKHTRTDPETGEVLDAGYAPCGRPWGTRLWPGGPILGGENWRDFAAKRALRTAQEAQTRAPRPSFYEPRGEWES